MSPSEDEKQSVNYKEKQSNLKLRLQEVNPHPVLNRKYMFALFLFPWLHIQRTAIQGAATGTNHKLCKLLHVIFIREFGNRHRRRQPAKSESLIRVVWKPTHTLLDFNCLLKY